MTDVFISYKQEEREAVEIIATTLNDLMVGVWFDTQLRSGGSFDEEIAAALSEAKAVLVCWTPAAIRSEWVRSEATAGMQTDRLAACFLQPTELIPPFNLTHSENLSAWAGQEDDPAWIKLLERIGDLLERPGLSTYWRTMRAGAPLEELRDWARDNGADPLVESVWARIALLEGEGATERLEREKAEAREADERRKARAERARRLARERGLQDPARQRRRFRLLVASVAATAMVSVLAIAYFLDAQTRDRTLRDEVTNVVEARTFLSNNRWHPIALRARERLASLDAAAWSDARTDGSIEAIEIYLSDAIAPPAGAFVAEARQRLASAQDTQRVQGVLSRLLLYRGPINGASNQETLSAIQRFRYRWNLPVSAEIDAALLQQLEFALERWIHPGLEDLRAEILGAPSEQDFIRLASEYGVEGATIQAVAQVESGANSGFGADGRLLIIFEPHVFSRLTNRQFDQSNPNVSYVTWDGRRYPRTQEGRWAQFAEAFALDQDAALRSTAYGKTGLMGFNYADYGFETAGEFARFLAQSEANQYEAMLRFARENDILDELQTRDWRGFARAYNGPAYAETRYHERLQEAYLRQRDAIAAEFDSTSPSRLRAEAGDVAEGTSDIKAPRAATAECPAEFVIAWDHTARVHEEQRTAVEDAARVLRRCNDHFIQVVGYSVPTEGPHMGELRADAVWGLLVASGFPSNAISRTSALSSETSGSRVVVVATNPSR